MMVITIAMLLNTTGTVQLILNYVKEHNICSVPRMHPVCRMHRSYSVALLSALLHGSAQGMDMVEAAAAAAEQYDPSKDPKRRPSKSKDPAWKFTFWPDLEKKDLLQCKLCNKKVYAGVARMKRHLGGGFQ